MIHLSSIKLPIKSLQVTIINNTTVQIFNSSNLQQFKSSNSSSSSYRNSSNSSRLQAFDALTEHFTKALHTFLSRRKQLFETDGTTLQELRTTLQQRHWITTLQWTVFNTFSHFFIRCEVALVAKATYTCF